MFKDKISRAINCFFGHHGSTVRREYLGFLDRYDMDVCAFCDTPISDEKYYDRLDELYGGPMKNKGFTLIELLVVIAIIGILAGVAIVNYSSYRHRGFDADVRSNVKNMIMAQEAYFVDTDAYADGTGTSQIFLDRGFRLSPNVNIVTTAFPTYFTIDGNAVKGCSAGTGMAVYSSQTGVTTVVKCN